MSAGESQQDSSMEEILASIRRIISEEDDGGEAKVEKSDEQEGAYLLELSKVVEDDDTTTDPARQGETADAEAQPAEEELPAATGEEALGEEFAAATDVVTEGEPEGESPLGSAGEATSDGFEVEASGAAEPQVQPGAGGDEPLVSEETADAATAPLAELAQAVELSSTVPVDAAGSGGRTVESLVVEVLRPMLREWLDKNLPPIIERLVEREIRHLARRAEPD